MENLNVIYNEVKSYLRNSEDNISEQRNVVRVLEKRSQDNQYSTAKKQELSDKAKNEKAVLDSMCKQAIEQAQNIVSKGVDSIRDKYSLKGEDLTDDVKLLNCGIKLSEKDIDSMLKRNAGNSTMIQVILQYAHENGIKKDVVFTELTELQKFVNNINNTIHYYAKWIDKDNAMKMLDKFFPGGDD